MMRPQVITVGDKHTHNSFSLRKNVRRIKCKQDSTYIVGCTMCPAVLKLHLVVEIQFFKSETSHSCSGTSGMYSKRSLVCTVPVNCQGCAVLGIYAGMVTENELKLISVEN